MKTYRVTYFKGGGHAGYAEFEAEDDIAAKKRAPDIVREVQEKFDPEHKRGEYKIFLLFWIVQKEVSVQVLL
ncbi:MAG: hypothetical protein WC806_02125 [Candidatus Gracilibacteria bacterium]|jgi:hypothetical protein